MAEVKNLATGPVLALDVGNARVGLAITDELRITAAPLKTLNRGGGREFTEIIQLIGERKISVIVVGLPFELDGSVGPQAEVSLAFKKQLEKKIKAADIVGVLVEQWDERFTSAAADRVLAGSKLKNRDRRAASDRVAAALILEGYLSNLLNR